MLGHVYCTFPMGKPLIIYCNALAFKEWPTNFKLLFQALLSMIEHACTASVTTTVMLRITIVC